MKKIYFILAATAVFFTSAVNAQGVIAGWDFNSNQDKSATINATSKDANLETPVLSRGDNSSYVDISYGYFIRAKAKSTTGNTEADGLTKKDYFLVTLKAGAGYKLSLSKIALKLRGTTVAGNSPNAYRWSYSTNGTDFTNINTETNGISFTSISNTGEVQTDISLSSITALQEVAATTTITLRMLVWGAGSVSATDIGFGRNTAGVAANVLAVEGELESLVPLPVNLTSFTAKPNTKTVELNWQTASEQSNSYFEVLRSADGSNFNVIGRKEGSGTTANAQNYNFTDAKPLVGTSYYALKQYDLNGSSKQYDAVPVKYNLSNASFTAVINGLGLNANINATKSEKAIIAILDISGNKIASKSLMLNEGLNQIELANINLTAGKLYLVNLRSDSQNQTVKIIK